MHELLLFIQNVKKNVYDIMYDNNYIMYVIK